MPACAWEYGGLRAESVYSGTKSETIPVLARRGSGSTAALVATLTKTSCASSPIGSFLPAGLASDPAEGAPWRWATAGVLGATPSMVLASIPSNIPSSPHDKLPRLWRVLEHIHRCLSMAYR